MTPQEDSASTNIDFFMPLRTALQHKRHWKILRAAMILLAAWFLLAWGAAKALIVRAELTQADAIVVLSNASAYVERVQYAAKLWKQGRAPRILLTNENLRGSWSEAEQRNPFFTERSRDELVRAGVPSGQIEVLPEMVNGTFDEAMLLRNYAARHNLRSILIVTSSYHSRRALWIFRRVLRGTGVNVGLDPVAPGQQTPRPLTWWYRVSGWKAVAFEYPKLLYYWVRYRNAGNATTAQYISVPLEQGPRTTVGSSRSGMTLSLTAPTTAYADEVVLIDARGSVGLSKKPQADGTPSVAIDFGDGFTCNLLACGHIYRTPGTYTITVSGKDSKRIAAIPVTATINVASIPTATGLNTNNAGGQNVIDMSNPDGNPAYYISSTNYRNAPANAPKLQQAIKRAAANNQSAEQEIVLPAGAVFAGPITMPEPVGSKYITIRSANMSSLTPGKRIFPAGDGGNMPTITAPSSRDMTMPALQTPATAPSSPSHHYRVQGLHLKKDDELRFSQVLVAIGPQYELNAVSKIAHHFIVDRCWVDGGTHDNAYGKDGMRITSNYVSVVDSYFSEFKILNGPDATGISVGTGQGPYAFWNNTIVAGTENFFFGGGSIKSSGTVSNPTTASATLSSVADLELDQNIAFKVGGVYSVKQSTIVRSITGNNITFDPIATAPDNGSLAEWITTPSYCEFRRNYLYKPLKWFPRHPSWNGTTYQIKNLWEAKLGRYILNDGNVFENAWIADQNYALQISPRNVTGGWSPASVLRDIQWTNNIVHNAASGVRITSSDYEPGYPSQLLTDVTFRNNLFWNVGVNFDSHGAGHELFGMANPYSVRMKRIFFIHNTDDNGSGSNSNRKISDFGSGTPPESGGADDSLWLNNVHQDSGYGFNSSLSGNAATNITMFLPPGNATTTAKNLVANTNGHNYPSWFITPEGMDWSALFVDYASGDFTLKPGKPGKNAATDGTDVGVDMTMLKAATAGTVSGVWTAVQSTRPRRISK